jgi:hypothetical protein
VENRKNGSNILKDHKLLVGNNQDASGRIHDRISRNSLQDIRISEPTTKCTAHKYVQDEAEHSAESY